MRRRTAITLMGATVFAGCSGGDTVDGTDTADSDATPTTTGSGTSAATARDDRPTETGTETSGTTENDDRPTDSTESEQGLFGPNARTYAGTGDDIIEGVSLQKGMTATKVSHEGDGRFKVVFEPQEDGYTQILVNSSGSYDSIEASLDSGGPYNIEITADGQWNLTLDEPRPETGEQLPASFEGSEESVFGPIEHDGTVRVVGTHEGFGDFGAYALPTNERIGVEIFDRNGMVETAETTVTLDGVYYIDVPATDDWTLKLTPK